MDWENSKLFLMLKILVMVYWSVIIPSANPTITEPVFLPDLTLQIHSRSDPRSHQISIVFINVYVMVSCGGPVWWSRVMARSRSPLTPFFWVDCVDFIFSESADLPAPSFLWCTLPNHHPTPHLPISFHFELGHFICQMNVLKEKYNTRVL